MIESLCAESDCSSCIVSQISEYSWCEELETHCDSDQDKASVDWDLASVSTMSTALSSSSESSVTYSGQILPDVKDCESKFFVSIHPCGDDHIYGSMKRLPEFQHTMNLWFNVLWNWHVLHVLAVEFISIILFTLTVRLSSEFIKFLFPPLPQNYLCV